MKPIYRLLYLIYRLGSSLWYRARRRFTLAGLCVAGGFLVAASVGVDVENNVVYQAFALLLALLLSAVAVGRFFRAKFSATRALPRFGTAGKPLPYRVRLKNLTGQAQTGLTLLENFTDPRPPFEEWFAFQLAENRRLRPFQISGRRRNNPFRRVDPVAVPVPPLAPRGETEVSVEILPLRRGVLRFTGLTLARPDPLGLFRAFSRISAPQTVLVLPKRYWLPPIALPGTMKYQQGGVALAANIGRSEEFVSLRDYRRGDPLRHIHWRSWARAGRPIVKEFEDEFFVRHALVLDTFTDERHSEILEEAVSVAASFACTVLTQESLLDLLFVGPESYCFTAGRGLAHADQMLEILASVRACGDRPFAALEHLVIAHVSVVSGCICVLQKWDDARKRLVEKLRALRLPVLVFVIVPPGQAKPDAGPLRAEPENFHVLEPGKIEEQLAGLS
ncbi:MAG TPA: DUF58 domain-containing protein [Verrucomicrobiae bacterium]|nr:DUF58 domain-containing protein [Verrucomicrobiae bacterium]